jgi:hypothetical protein
MCAQLFVVLLVLSMALCVWNLMKYNWVPQPFNSTRWKEAPAKSDVRLWMYQDLRKCLIGLSKNEVTAILGTPDEIGDSANTLIYYMGPSPIPADTEILLLRLENDNVVEYDSVSR